MTRSVCSVRLSCMYVLKRDIKKRMLALSVRWLVDEGKSGSPRMLASELEVGSQISVSMLIVRNENATNESMKAWNQILVRSRIVEILTCTSG